MDIGEDEDFQLNLDVFLEQQKNLNKEIEKVLDRQLLEVWFSIPGVEEDAVSELCCAFLDPGDHAAKERVPQVRDHNAENASTAFDEASRHDVWAVVEPLDSFEDYMP